MFGGLGGFRMGSFPQLTIGLLFNVWVLFSLGQDHLLDLLRLLDLERQLALRLDRPQQQQQHPGQRPQHGCKLT
jgi:hypothetical protein